MMMMTMMMVCVSFSGSTFSSILFSQYFYPVLLPSLSPFIHSFISSFYAAPERRPGSGAALYDCVGVVNHMGGLGGGHYTADCLNRDTGNWHTFNDSRVSSQSAAGLSGSSAYVLFYVRKG